MFERIVEEARANIEHCEDLMEYCTQTHCEDCANGCEMEIDYNKTLIEYLEMAKKYKELEEQGLLLRLPCKVGDYLYTLESIYITPIRLNDVIVSFAGLNNYVYQYNCCSFDECGDVLEEYEFDDNDFGKTVFLTREEAEKALADMGV